jgi:hypothetical protein
LWEFRCLTTLRRTAGMHWTAGIAERDGCAMGGHWR